METINEVLENLTLDKISEIELGRSVVNRLLREYSRPKYVYNGYLARDNKDTNFKFILYSVPEYLTTKLKGLVSSELIRENISGYDIEFLKSYFLEMIKVEVLMSVFKYGELEESKRMINTELAGHVAGVKEINEILTVINTLSTMLGVKLDQHELLNIITEFRSKVIDDIKDFISTRLGVEPVHIFGYSDIKELDMFVSFSLVGYEYIPTEFLLFVFVD